MVGVIMHNLLTLLETTCANYSMAIVAKYLELEGFHGVFRNNTRALQYKCLVWEKKNMIWKRYHHLFLGPLMLYNVGWSTMCTYNIHLICLVWILLISVACNIYHSQCNGHEHWRNELQVCNMIERNPQISFLLKKPCSRDKMYRSTHFIFIWDNLFN